MFGWLFPASINPVCLHINKSFELSFGWLSAFDKNGKAKCSCSKMKRSVEARWWRIPHTSSSDKSASPINDSNLSTICSFLTSRSRFLWKKMNTVFGFLSQSFRFSSMLLTAKQPLPFLQPQSWRCFLFGCASPSFPPFPRSPGVVAIPNPTVPIPWA